MIELTIKLPVEHLCVLSEYFMSIQADDVAGEAASRQILGDIFCDALSEQMRSNG